MALNALGITLKQNVCIYFNSVKENVRFFKTLLSLNLFFAAVVQLVVSGQLVVYQLCKGLGVLHVAVSSCDIIFSPWVNTVTMILHFFYQFVKKIHPSWMFLTKVWNTAVLRTNCTFVFVWIQHRHSEVSCPDFWMSMLYSYCGQTKITYHVKKQKSHTALVCFLP